MCPECNSNNVKTENQGDRIKYTCKDCGSFWFN